jgi:hypothetical protein
MRKITVLFILALGLVAAAPAQAGIPDLYSGSWPAKLMPSNEALGTITWVPVSDEWGRGVLDQPWGGAPFTNCPATGQTRFFLGRYGTGGRLIACTIGADGRELHGRYDGAGGEFRPGSFDVKIIKESPRIFFGQYVEDGGITTDWCGELIPSSAPDVLAPTARALTSSGRSGKAVRLRLTAADDRKAVRVSVTIKRAGKRIASFATGFRRVDGSPMSLLWRPRHRLRGAFTFSVRVFDRYGNASRPSSAALRIR